MRPTEDLAVRAATLQRNAPLEWAAFMKALAVYVEMHRENLVKSPVAELPVNQGRAQSLTSLLEALTEAHSTADKIRKKQ